ncbi:hypothetical protein A6M21_05740 [Desulfotomaculum copahuensis]|uniref:Uncharacterized protein n=1 Tax=Desulfotomaculum copahuensis TaxID=1838280 RepID=A0A1B7LGU5_9FIRM|nr:hypothetical protein A6M21_05740 [Desulfotomaculum copahuensis]
MIRQKFTAKTVFKYQNVFLDRPGRPPAGIRVFLYKPSANYMPARPGFPGVYPGFLYKRPAPPGDNLQSAGAAVHADASRHQFTYFCNMNYTKP